MVEARHHLRINNPFFNGNGSTNGRGTTTGTRISSITADGDLNRIVIDEVSLTVVADPVEDPNPPAVPMRLRRLTTQDYP